ncbi:deazaflavin-dependent nitroreductase [Microlunatus speluncae]|uniref:deazaflavin-dependent nitroreductase n=1 Tax=Microlunatus speluncae TaxID=2594267 RepID=UPI00126620F6|nr:deazaflavin-dependent nitroreductase [Microlunatus speluncae]
MTSSSYQVPRYVRWANPLIKVLNRLGLTIGTMRVIAVPGRKSGRLRSTPVSPVTVQGRRYAIAGISGSDWAKNARAAGWGTLSTGRRTEQIALTEVIDPDEQRAVLRTFPVQVPHGVDFFIQAGVVTGPTPEEFERGVGRCVIFRITPRSAPRARPGDGAHAS